jgi:copper oxidase (laccase) domain-containing protein
VAAVAWRCPTARGDVVVVQSTRADGDFHRDLVGAATLRRRRRDLVDAPWTMLAEVHGCEVVTVAAPGEGDGAVGDVAVTAASGAVLGVWTADCAPLVAVAPDGRFGVAHAGWRGLAAAVVDVLVDAVDPRRAGGVRAHLGPAIGPCCDEFGPAELALVAAAAGGAPVTATTTWGTPSLDVPGAIAAMLARRGVELDRSGACTRCDERYFSHRRGDRGRHVTAAWRP